MAAMRMGLGLGLSRRQYAQPRKAMESLSHELILPSQLLEVSAEVDEGSIIVALSEPWNEIYRQISSNPDLITGFSEYPRKFEEFIATSYERAGYNVVLTPRSGDGGTDIIAQKPGVCALRIIDQCKAYRKGHKVSPNDVRAMMGTLMRNTNASKAVISTTSVFAPSVRTEWEDYLPYRLELREGSDIISWLESLNKQR